MTEATRDRLITAAMALFAERGTRGTTIGDIEEGADLTRRGGAFYKHFHSKDEILEAGIEREIRRAETVRGVVDLLPLGDLRAELTLLCRLLLGELSRQRDLTRVLEKEGEQIQELRDRLFERVIQVDYRLAAQLTHGWVKESGIEDIDVEAVTTMMLGAIINYRRTQWTFGGTPLGVDENRFVEAWVDGCARLFEALRGSNRDGRPHVGGERP
jgi:AcrR family transcriptional regulator